MRVLHVYRTYFPDSHGGLEQSIRQICLTTKSLGADTRVLAVSPDPSPSIIEREEATVYRVPLTFEVASCSVSFGALRAFRGLSRWADVIHYHFPWPFADILHLLRHDRTPSVVTYHSDIVRQRFLAKLYAPLMNRFLQSVSRIVCTSPNYFATSDVLARYSDKVDTVPIGLSEDSYPKVDDNTLAEVRDQFGHNFFLFVGVLRYYKGLHILLEAMKRAPYRVVIVGSGPIERALRQQAAELQLDNVVFAGYVSEATKVALFKLSRGVVFPSYLRSEAFGVALLEGAMYAKPLISTEVGSGTSHINIDHKTGIVVAPGNAKALRHAMDQLYTRPDMATLMGKRARERYEQLFTARVMGKRYMDTYGSVLGIEEEPIAASAG